MKRLYVMLVAALIACNGKHDGPAVKPSVAIEGYGIRLRLAPPFSVGRSPVGPNGRADQFIVAHFGDGGALKNVIVVPALTSGARDIHPVTTPMPGLQVGTDGTQVFFGAAMSSLDDVGTLEPGSGVASWTIVSGSSGTPWPVGKIIKSTTGEPGFELTNIGAQH